MKSMLFALRLNDLIGGFLYTSIYALPAAVRVLGAALAASFMMTPPKADETAPPAAVRPTEGIAVVATIAASNPINAAPPMPFVIFQSWLSISDTFLAFVDSATN